MIYAIDAVDNTRDSVRELTKNFFIKELGFLESEIEFFDRDHFYKDQTGDWQVNFSDEEKKRLNDSTKRIFEDK